jgi:hypothetical protein
VYQLLPCPDPTTISMCYKNSCYPLEQILQGTNYGLSSLPQKLDFPFMPNSVEIWIDQSLVTDVEKSMFRTTQTFNLPSWLVSVREQMLWGSLYYLCCEFLDEARRYRPISHRVADFIKFISLVTIPESYQNDSSGHHISNFLDERKEFWKKLSGTQISQLLKSDPKNILIVPFLPRHCPGFTIITSTGKDLRPRKPIEAPQRFRQPCSWG